MRMLRLLSLLAGTLTLAAPLASGQTVTFERSVVAGADQMPVFGQNGRQFKTGTGRVRGRVLSADSGTPLRRAQVRIGGAEAAPRTALTDGDGRFEFSELPAGRLSLSASKAGYVDIQYGQTRPFESGKPIELAEGQSLDKADLILPRGSVVAGRVVDEFGEPLTDAMVTALRQQWTGGRRRLVATGRIAQTNDLGQYRVYGLPPGDYYLSATVRNVEAMSLPVGLNVNLPQRQTPDSGYAPTYYPGTPSNAEAQKVTVALGQEAQGIDFALVPVRLARISGIVLNSEGRPVESAMVSALPSRGAESGPMFGGGGGATTKGGAFTITGVAPGEYTLQVRSVNIVTSSGSENTFVMMTRVSSDGGGGDAENASVPVTVTGEDISNLVITTAKGVTASGRLVIEGTRPQSFGMFRVVAQPAGEQDGPQLFGPGGSAVVKDDGTFSITGVLGQRTIRLAGLPPGYALKAVEHHGVDVTDTGIEFRSGEPVDGIDVVLTTRVTEVSGGVTAPGGSPAADYTVVVFPQDAQKWRSAPNRWIFGVRPGQDGRFRVSALPPGSYYAVAMDYIAQGDWFDPDLLERLRNGAEAFTLGDGETKGLALTLRGGA